MAQLKLYSRNRISFGIFERSVTNRLFKLSFGSSRLEFYSEFVFDEQSPLLSVVGASFLNTLSAHRHGTQRLVRLRSTYFSMLDGMKFIA
jgi:hypothetical protein